MRLRAGVAVNTVLRFTNPGPGIYRVDSALYTSAWRSTAYCNDQSFVIP